MTGWRMEGTRGSGTWRDKAGMRKNLGLLFLVLGVSASAGAQSSDAEARLRVPWLDVPVGWMFNLEDGVVGVMPNDLSPDASLIFLVEPPSNSSEPLAEAYDRALRDLGPWQPVGEPLQDQLANGWVFLHGVGVATLNGSRFTGHTAVARRGDQRVRIWVLANSDATYNQYKGQILTAIASVQDIRADGVVAAAPAAAQPGSAAGGAPTGFGEGISGVYFGLERGASASAGVAPGGGPTASSYIGDFEEVDVFYPDGTYRRRLPIRGLASDPAWERQQQPALWGSWSRDGNQITVRRGSYSTTYTVDGENLVSDRGRPWMKISTPTDLRLAGTFARADYRDPGAPRIVLRADGTYEDSGGFLRMVGSAWNLVIPDGAVMVERWNDAQAQQAMAGGSGTYSYDAFTLTLRDQDGRVWQTNALVPPGEPLPQPRRLFINGRALVRD